MRANIEFSKMLQLKIIGARAQAVILTLHCELANTRTRRYLVGRHAEIETCIPWLCALDVQAVGDSIGVDAEVF